RAGGTGAERDARVHPRQPSARLPGLRQGWRVSAAGPHLPLRARQHTDELREAHVREAGPDLAHDRARPRALHPLLPLHALQRGRRHGLEQVSWEQAVDEAERLLRDARGRIVTVLSGSETVEQAYALARLLRVGLDSHQAMLPEEISGALDAYRLPLSAIRE